MIQLNTKARGTFTGHKCEVSHTDVHEPMSEVLQQILDRVSETIVAVWPLADYVAVNPCGGFAEYPLLEARRRLRDFSDCELLMPLTYYAARYRRGEFAWADIEAAVDELRRDSRPESLALSAEQIIAWLNEASTSAAADDHVSSMPHADRRIHTVSEYLDRHQQSDWTTVIREEISKHCAAHYDEGQATWTSPWQHLPLYQAWRSAVQYDRNLEWLGVSKFRRFASQLPHTAEEAIVYCLQRLGIPQRLWEVMLLCQAYSIPGWSAWARYQDQMAQRAGQQNTHLVGLLAIRLAYDVVLAECFTFTVHWGSIHGEPHSLSDAHSVESPDDPAVRHVLLRASEIAYRRRLLEKLVDRVAADNSLTQSSPRASNPATRARGRKLAQVAFCIDVRSERFRRHLESVSPEIETLGFAGFFGIPLEYVPLGQTEGSRQVPLLLTPQFKLHEGLRVAQPEITERAVQRRDALRSWRKAWKDFATSAYSCFTCVETSGLLFGLRLFGRTTGLAGHAPEARFDGIPGRDRPSLGPTMRDLNRQGLTTSRQTDLAESVLRGLGLTDNFARLVVFCGHTSQTENNPLQAGLDCGACGGHSGEPNARFAALLLNQPYIRRALVNRGIQIPKDVWFLAAVHNTTTDTMELFDVTDVPQSHLGDLREFAACRQAASERTRVERLPQICSRNVADLLRRSRDWSEVRPEWGLAGNAAFLAAPRTLTEGVNLDGRAFLHNYDYQQDEDGSVLRQILTAPLIVAHLINMQYYASTVDNRHFGSGTKTVHNVVGRFGILSGNSGDLMTGLPWESLHNGTSCQHHPQRLLAVIAAPREAIDNVVNSHAMLKKLLTNGWVQLIALDDQSFYRYNPSEAWDVLEERAGQLC